MAVLTIQERVAWLHKSATTLQVEDLTELKFAVKALGRDCSLLFQQISNELHTQRFSGMESEGAECTATDKKNGEENEDTK